VYLYVKILNVGNLVVKSLMARDHVDQILAQWRRERPDVDASPMGVVGRVKRLAQLFERATAENFARHGLEPHEFDVLASLRRAGPPHRLSAGRLGRALMITSGTVTNRIDRLEQSGWVVRTDDPADRRGVLIELTPEGLGRVDDVLEHHLRTETRLIAPLRKGERGELAALLRRLLIAQGDAEPVTGPGPRFSRRASGRRPIRKSRPR
jgi:DNA-binding MarR family transcriptional regulator